MGYLRDSNMSNQRILEVCRNSQEIVYDGKSKGINFLVSLKRVKDDFISISDVEIFRERPRED